MKHLVQLLVFVACVALTLAACSSTGPAAPATATKTTPEDLPADVDAATVKAVQGRDDVVVLDVREQAEYDAGRIPGVKLIPMSEIANRLSEIPKDKTVIVTCRSGNRSSQVAEYLRRQGYTNIHNMLGGINAWQQAGYAIEK